MTTGDSSGQFWWGDRCGLIWHGHMEDTPPFLTWRLRPENVGGRYEVHVKTHSFDSGEQLPMAHLTDVRVERRMENRGAGSMLVRRAIEECKRRGHKGIKGDLSSVDMDHFDKLKHFYEKLGFTVIFYEPEHPDYRNPWDGKIEMTFGEECPPLRITEAATNQFPMMRHASKIG